MFRMASYSIHYRTVIAILISTNSEASVTWKIKTKPIIIGEEAILSCYANNCPPENTKKWLGGKNYDLLCQDNQSKDPLKYEMTSNGTNFDLMINKIDFTDVDCEYTCACGFQQYTSMLKAEELLYPPRLQEKTLTQKGDKFHINLLMKAYPIPKCKLLFQNMLLSVNISVRSLYVDEYFGMFEVDILQTVGPSRSICKENITLHCEVGTNEYSFHLHKLDLCKEKETTKDVLYICIGLIAGILSFVSFLVCIKYKVSHAILMKHSTEIRKENNPALTDPCMVQMIKELHNTGATDERTP